MLFLYFLFMLSLAFVIVIIVLLLLLPHLIHFILFFSSSHFSVPFGLAVKIFIKQYKINVFYSYSDKMFFVLYFKLHIHNTYLYVGIYEVNK